MDALRPGDDFVETIHAKLEQSDVLLAVIGPRWLTAVDSRGTRRLDDAADHLRVEIEAALYRELRLIPVLVNGASMPSSDHLPESLGALSRRHAIELRDARWADDLAKLIGQLRTLDPVQSAEGRHGRTSWLAGLQRWSQRRYVALAFGAVAVAVAVSFAVRDGAQPIQDPPGPDPLPSAPDLVESVVSRLQARCDGRETLTACRELGNMYLHGQDVERDYARAATLYSQGCEAGDMGGCFELGAVYGEGLGVEVDASRALALYRRACDGGFAGGCLNLGYMYSEGQGVPIDEVAARPLYERACEGGEPIACRNLGFSIPMGVGVWKPMCRVLASSFVARATAVTMRGACTFGG